MFAHRGGSRLAPENTIAAFDRAVSEGVDGLELDVHLAKDGEVVVCHDASVNRTTEGAGAIASMTARELAALDAGYHFSDGDGRRPFRGRGIGIPTLREIVARYPAHRLIVEMKDDETALAQATLRVIREADGFARTCLGSFHLDVIEDVRRREPRAATSAAQREVRMALYRSWVGLFRARSRTRRCSCRSGGRRHGSSRPPSCVAPTGQGCSSRSGWSMSRPTWSACWAGAWTA